MDTSAHASDDALETLERELALLVQSMMQFERTHAARLLHIADRHRASARNLLHYLAMRREDLRRLQPLLASRGLSSLGRAEAHAMFAVTRTLDAVRRLADGKRAARTAEPPCDFASGTELLTRNTTALFGSPTPHRGTHIMVTVGTEAAHDYALVQRLLEQGMSCMRINCAHDGAQDWQRMIEHLRQASAALGRPCSVLMDLAGPKLRTGEVAPGAAVLKIKPQRDIYGRITAPARLWLSARGAPTPPPALADGAVQIGARWLEQIRVGDRPTLRDARGRRRTLRIIDIEPHGAWAELHRTAYLTDRMRLTRAAVAGRPGAATALSGISALPGVIALQAGDELVLTRERIAGCNAAFDFAGRMLHPAHVSCTLPQVFMDARAGQRVGLDDGRITATIDAVTPSELRLRIVHTPPRGARLKGDKGINLPDSELRLPALTDKDRQDLKFVVQHADMVGLSFVNNESDVAALLEALQAAGDARPGIVLKIETQRGFRRLPAVLLAALQHERVGVMIARGDLAVECGYERLAEAQEEILWICEAAHCPAIWATQVLETLAREGTPSRAEITDAAMGNRAECVMLNKGPHLDDALRVLDDILTRMDAHQDKKSAMLRALKLAEEFDEDFTLERGSPVGSQKAAQGNERVD